MPEPTPAKGKADGSDGWPHVVLGLSPNESNQETMAAALAHVLSRPDSIRQRAQNAATISSAVAAALVIAALGQLAGDESFGRYTKTLVIIAIVLWAASAAMFVHAVAFGDKPNARGAADRNAHPQADYQALVNNYETYADGVRRRMRSAAVCSAIALLLTAAAVLLAVVDLTASDEKPMRLTLSPAGTSTVLALCEWSDMKAPLTHIEGVLPPDKLGDLVVRVSDVTGFFKPASEQEKSPKPRTCTTTKKLHLRRATVRGALELRAPT